MSQLIVRSARPMPLWDAVSPRRMVSNLWRYRELIHQLTVRETVAMHRGTNLGMAWLVAEPLLRLGVYTFIFAIVLGFRWTSMKGTDSRVEYALTLFCGIVIFGVLGTSLGRAPTLVTSKPNFVRKVVFPLEILPLAVVGSALFYALIGVLVLMAGVLLATGRVSPTAYMFPLVLVPLALLSLGVSWLLASLGVFIRDVNQVVQVFVQQVLFLMTPIFYPIDIVPEHLRFWLMLNPLAEIVQDARRTLIWGEQPHWRALGLVTLASIGMLLFGYAWFVKTRRGFADVL